MAAACRIPRSLDYRASGRPGEQVDRLKALALERQLHTIVSDHLRSDPSAACRANLRFFGVPLNGQSAILVANARETQAELVLDRFVKCSPALIHWSRAGGKDTSFRRGPSRRTARSRAPKKGGCSGATPRRNDRGAQRDMDLLGALAHPNLNYGTKHSLLSGSQRQEQIT